MARFIPGDRRRPPRQRSSVSTMEYLETSEAKKKKTDREHRMRLTQTFIRNAKKHGADPAHIKSIVKSNDFDPKKAEGNIANLGLYFSSNRLTEEQKRKALAFTLNSLNEAPFQLMRNLDSHLNGRKKRA